MNIGRLDKRIQIVKYVSGGVDAEGYDSDVVEELVWECWAQVSQTSGTELVKADAELSDEKKRFLIRYVPISIHSDMSIRYDGDDYNILMINTYGDNHEYTEIWCRKVDLV